MHRLDPKQLYLKVKISFSISKIISTSFFLAIIHHQIDSNKRAADTYLFKYVLDYAPTYNIQYKIRNSVRLFLIK